MIGALHEAGLGAVVEEEEEVVWWSAPDRCLSSGGATGFSHSPSG